MIGDVNLVTIFLTGLVTGGLTCIAVQGGLLTAMLAQREEEKLEDASHKVKEKYGKILPISSFLIAKLVAYTVLGALLGWLGSVLRFSVQAQMIFQLEVVIFMLGAALNLLQVHPIFRYFAIQPPRFLSRLVRMQSKRKDLFAPAILGAFTVFIPCGTTQAMMVLATASGNPVVGAIVLFTFILGTSPVFFLLGYATMKLGDVFKTRFAKLAATALILLALMNLDGAIALSGSSYTLQSTLQEGLCLISYCKNDAVVLPQVSEQTILITPTGYSPNNFAVKAGSHVRVHLENKNAVGCLQSFTIPSMNLQQVVLPNSTRDLTFTAPPKPGRILFTCSMGMYPGTIRVM